MMSIINLYNLDGAGSYVIQIVGQRLIILLKDILLYFRSSALMLPITKALSICFYVEYTEMNLLVYIYVFI